MYVQHKHGLDDGRDDAMQIPDAPGDLRCDVFIKHNVCVRARVGEDGELHHLRGRHVALRVVLWVIEHELAVFFAVDHAVRVLVQVDAPKWSHVHTPSNQ